MSGVRLLVKNSAANVAAGMGNALLAVALPPILVRHLSLAEFSAWSVALQLAAVVNVLQFGVQVAVGRYVAYYSSRSDRDHLCQIVSTALAAMWLAAGLAIVLLAAMGASLPRWFPGLPEALVGDARAVLWGVGISLALGLPASVVAGVYAGLQRNEVPAYLVVASRVAAAGVLVVLAVRGAGLMAMALGYLLTIGGAALLQLALMPRHRPEFVFRRSAVTRIAARELVGYCASITIWSISLLAISGLDAAIAARFDFTWAGRFGVAASLVALLVGVQSAMLQPFVAIAAKLHRRDEKTPLSLLLYQTTRLNALFFLAAITPLFVAGEWIATAWVGAEMGREVLPIARVLLLGIFLRQTLAPFATLLLATGEQRIIALTPLYEAAAKLVASVSLASWLGPVGIALGTLIGGVVCLVTNMLLSFPRVRGLSFARGPFLVNAIGMPTLLFVPLLALPLAGAAESAGGYALRAAIVVLVAIGAGAMAIGAFRRLRDLV